MSRGRANLGPGGFRPRATSTIPVAAHEILDSSATSRSRSSPAGRRPAARPGAERSSDSIGRSCLVSKPARPHACPARGHLGARSIKGGAAPRLQKCRAAACSLAVRELSNRPSPVQSSGRLFGGRQALRDGMSLLPRACRVRRNKVRPLAFSAAWARCMFASLGFLAASRPAQLDLGQASCEREGWQPSFQSIPTVSPGETQ